MGNEGETVHDGDCQECIHHWLIDERNFGVCKKCGANKQFGGWWSPVSVQIGRGTKSSKVQHNIPGTNK